MCWGYFWIFYSGPDNLFLGPNQAIPSYRPPNTHSLTYRPKLDGGDENVCCFSQPINNSPVTAEFRLKIPPTSSGDVLYIPLEPKFPRSFTSPNTGP